MNTMENSCFKLNKTTWKWILHVFSIFLMLLVCTTLIEIFAPSIQLYIQKFKCDNYLHKKVTNICTVLGLAVESWLLIELDPKVCHIYAKSTSSFELGDVWFITLITIIITFYVLPLILQRPPFSFNVSWLVYKQDPSTLIVRIYSILIWNVKSYYAIE